MKYVIAVWSDGNDSLKGKLGYLQYYTDRKLAITRDERQTKVYVTLNGARRAKAKLMNNFKNREFFIEQIAQDGQVSLFEEEEK